MGIVIKVPIDLQGVFTPEEVEVAVRTVMIRDGATIEDLYINPKSYGRLKVLQLSYDWLSTEVEDKFTDADEVIRCLNDFGGKVVEALKS